MVELPAWCVFRDHVEGNESAFSSAVIDGRVHWHSSPVVHGAPPTLVPLIDLLRSEMEIPQKIRNWLADMMTPGSDTACSLSIGRKRGRPAASLEKYTPALEHFADLRGRNVPHKVALHETMQKFDIKRTVLLSLWKALNLARFG